MVQRVINVTFYILKLFARFYTSRIAFQILRRLDVIDVVREFFVKVIFKWLEID